MAEDNCIFCKIARGVIPSTTVYEDEDFRVILDLGPASKGHSLILPKKHFANVCEHNFFPLLSVFLQYLQETVPSPCLFLSPPAALCRFLFPEILFFCNLHFISFF